jgi:hypothetical protein
MPRDLSSSRYFLVLSSIPASCTGKSWAETLMPHTAVNQH